MKTVGRILEGKQTKAVHSIAPEARVLDAVKLMAEKKIGALLVMEGKEVVGIVTLRA